MGAAGLCIATLTGCPDPEPDNFGTVRIEMAPVGGDLNIFSGTVEVVATVNYEGCLQDFYLLNQPGYQKDGPEGAEVFDEFIDKLCGYDDTPDCEVLSIDQTLLENTDVYNLRVTFRINDPSTLAYSEVHVGPLPTEAFAGCGDGELPTVDLRASGLVGFDADGVQIWRISTLPASTEAVADQGAPLRVDIVAN